MIIFIRVLYDWFEYNIFKNNLLVLRIDLVKFLYKIFK